MNELNAIKDSLIAGLMLRTFAFHGLLFLAAAAHASGMEPATLTSADQKKGVADEEAAAAYDFTEFRRLLTEPVDEGRIPCASAILIHNDKVIFKEAVGLADMEDKLPFTVDTICHVGSTTKWISGATLMAMVDEGKISLDEPAGKYLPRYRDMPIKEGNPVLLGDGGGYGTFMWIDRKANLVGDYFTQSRARPNDDLLANLVPKAARKTVEASKAAQSSERKKSQIPASTGQPKPLTVPAGDTQRLSPKGHAYLDPEVLSECGLVTFIDTESWGAGAAPTAESFKQAADYSARHGGRAVLVMVAGKTMFERYDNGFGPDTATHLHSATKGFWGPVIAAMIEDELITSFDELASKTLPEWKEHPRKSRITLRHLLTLSAGLVQDVVNLQGHDRPTLAPDLYKHAIGVSAARRAGCDVPVWPQLLLRSG